MKNIKQLPSTVQSLLRSSVVLSDLPRIVEELLSNSIDASATKVFVSVSVVACCLKIEDDGCGITRDGLVLLGERHASSKIDWLTDVEMDLESMDSIGETLGSLSDISLVEIRTKARGKPNAYCKIIKGWKCLFLGIDSEKEDVGTTVIVRDLFYNQPVRRKYILSSPKKIMHSIKKCVFRTALVHPEISFRVKGIETEDELLCTSSSSPLELVSENFGNEVSSSLHAIGYANEILKLSGYLSHPGHDFVKGVQYFYVNSRFICKGPIHSLINSQATLFMASTTGTEGFQGKRKKTQAFASYILNLSCPPSSYCLTFEPSKTVVDFKDWNVVLDFVKQTIMQFWKDFLTQLVEEKSFPDQVREDTIEEKLNVGSEILNSQITDEGKLQSPKTRKRKCSDQFYLMSPTHCQLRPYQSKLNGTSETDSQKDVLCEPHPFVSTYSQGGFRTITIPSRTHGISSPDDSFFSKQTYSVDKEHNLLGLKCKIDSLKDDIRFTKSTYSLATHEGDAIMNNLHDIPSQMTFMDVIQKPGENCSLMEKEEFSSPCHTGHASDITGIEQYPEQFSLDCREGANVACYNTVNHCVQEPAGVSLPFGTLRRCHTTKIANDFLGDKTDHSYDLVSSIEGNSLYNELASRFSANGPEDLYMQSDRCPGSSHSFCALIHDLDTAHRYDEDKRFMEVTHYSQLQGLNEKTCGFPMTRLSGCYDTIPGMSFSNDNINHNLSNLKEDFCVQQPSSINGGMLCSSRKIHYEAGFSNLDDSTLHPIEFYMKPTFPHGQNDHMICERPCDNENYEEYQISRIRSRSHSAPPFYKGKRKFSSINGRPTSIKGREACFHLTVDNVNVPANTFSSVDLPQPCTLSQQYSLDVCIGASQSLTGDGALGKPLAIGASGGRISNLQISSANILEEFIIHKPQCESALTKWRNCSPQGTYEDRHWVSDDCQNDILDISSGLLHFAGNSLIPECINKDDLKNAKVLLQLDKKFIPVVARGILLVLDQHAADERIRLEELRQKVLCGEARNVTYLDCNKDLVLPEECFQLLENYDEHIHKWGWIYKIHGQCSESFSKSMKLLKKQSYTITLVAVPCILGTDLTDKDLLEFLKQLAETDGSSTLPSAVVRVLNFKACRGAIMFGDSLLPSECSLLFEELQKTSLCFQCAHGRPTAAPLLDMVVLHEQLSKLSTLSNKREPWHGLCHHRPSIERAQQRLASAERFQTG